MILYPNAKVNLGLNVISKRGDGYHNIETVFYPIPWCDILEIIPAGENEKGVLLSLSGIPVPGSAEENLCRKAYALLSQHYDVPALRAHLHKRIPTGAGLGGGSSDAAFFMKGVSELCDLNLSWGELHHFAKQIGADCSFFITNRPAYAQEKGDDLEGVDLSLAGKYIVAAHPGIAVSTKEAYAGVVPEQPLRCVKDIVCSEPPENWKDILVNDFEKSVFEKYPAIRLLKEKMYSLGALYASMSGSGSAVYGIFNDKPAYDDVFEGCSVFGEQMV
ncbi:MAG TPA: 4-(cytidine 5'-diphospho)-2-C-methyl-D-erythritol kinase [Bacteroidia bacterium]|nr:4-(cytidine 5'-diphospho)-2-C-methyl-D-erythritol kinase [Bacteroidia bacterium]